MQDITYVIGNSLYLNITNRCTNDCTFCIRYKAHEFQGKHNLWLEHEPTIDEMKKAIGDPKKYDQIVFCGYGESLIRLDIVKELATWIKSITAEANHPIIRIDTNGQANLFHGRNILPELKGLIDYISISLNAEKSELYDALCNSFFGSKAYGAIIEFIREAKNYIPLVEISIVDLNSVDKKKSEQIAKDLGVQFRIRPYYEEKYVP